MISDQVVIDYRRGANGLLFLGAIRVAITENFRGKTSAAGCSEAGALLRGRN